MNDFKSAIDRELHTPVHMGAMFAEEECRCNLCGGIIEYPSQGEIVNRMPVHRECNEETKNDNL